MARFAQYAMAASEEALNDAGWAPKSEEDLQNTVGRLSGPYRSIINVLRVSI